MTSKMLLVRRKPGSVWATRLLAPRKPDSIWATSATTATTLSGLTSVNRHRNPTLRASPTRVLALRISRQHTDQLERYTPQYKVLAHMTNERLPVITFQKLLLAQDPGAEGELSKIVRQMNPATWRDRINSLESRGWAESDIDHWVWILSAHDIDARILRFVSTVKRKPVFLLLVIIQDARPIQSGRTLQKLLTYLDKHYCSPSPERKEKDPNQRLEMTFSSYARLLRRLVRHGRTVRHSSLVALANLTRNYIQHLPQIEPPLFLYRRQCRIFNAALQYFALPAQYNPVRNMEYNWLAQKKLLAMSDGMERPLVIDKHSYRAIRRVLVALQKSQAERAVARRYSPSWPPYRQDFDGHDAQRTPDDDLSRSFKAGVLMTEAGYEKDDYDRALDVLGGSSEGTPTIQTRSLTPTEGGQRKEKFFTMWAMKVRATRNTQEAWRVFNSFAASTNMTPPLQVYTEMLLKLGAGTIDGSRNVLPGDTRESFPVHHGNYSEYELARLTPPTAQELYQQMIHQGVKPRGICLQHLVATASTLEEGQSYLLDGGVDPALVAHLTQKDHSRRRLQKMPLLLFKSYIQLLCRLHPNRRGRDAIPEEELSYINQAFRLCRCRLPPHSAEAASFRPVWQIICAALGRPDLALVNGERVDNDMAALYMFLKVEKWVKSSIGMDHEVFISFCRTVQKLAISQMEQHRSSHSSDAILHDNSRAGHLLRSAHSRLQEWFTKFTVANSEKPPGMDLPDFIYSITPVYLHTYMRTLALLGDVEGMVVLMDWVFANRELVEAEAGRKSGDGGRLMVVKMLCAFEAFGGPQLDAETRVALDAKMVQASKTGGSWDWPSAEDIKSYIDSDKRGGSQALQRRILGAWWQDMPQQDTFLQEAAT